MSGGGVSRRWGSSFLGKGMLALAGSCRQFTSSCVGGWVVLENRCRIVIPARPLSLLVHPNLWSYTLPKHLNFSKGKKTIKSSNGLMLHTGSQRIESEFGFSSGYSLVSRAAGAAGADATVSCTCLGSIFLSMSATSKRKSSRRIRTWIRRDKSEPGSFQALFQTAAVNPSILVCNSPGNDAWWTQLLHRSKFAMTSVLFGSTSSFRP